MMITRCLETLDLIYSSIRLYCSSVTLDTRRNKKREIFLGNDRLIGHVILRILATVTKTR